MFETYDTNQKAYVERTAQYYDLNLKAWVDVPSAMTYDTTEKAWVERLYEYWLTSWMTNISSADDLNVSPSMLGLVIDAYSDTKTRSVIYTCSNHDIKIGDTFEAEVFRTYGVAVSISLSYKDTSGSSQSISIYSKTKTAAESHETINKVISASNVKSFGDLTVSISYTYNSNAQIVSAAVAGIKVNGKKIGFAE